MHTYIHIFHAHAYICLNIYLFMHISLFACVFVSFLYMLKQIGMRVQANLFTHTLSMLQVCEYAACCTHACLCIHMHLSIHNSYQLVLHAKRRGGKPVCVCLNVASQSSCCTEVVSVILPGEAYVYMY